MGNIFTADFETNNTIPASVWVWGVMDIESGVFNHSTNFDNFFLFMQLNPGKYYFHNEKFDGGFIIDWLLKHDFQWAETYVYSDKAGKASRRNLKPGEFNTCISDMNVFYSISICILNKQIEIWDSLKIIPMALEKIPTAFKITTTKGEIDYNKPRPAGYNPTLNEILYLYRDVRVAALAVKYMLTQGQTHMTTGSNAFYWFKSLLGKKKYDRFFPQIKKEDRMLRAAYRGGYCIVNPAFQGLNIGEGIVFDKNSMYPWALHDMPMPYGLPQHFEGKYKPTQFYPLYVQNFSCAFKLKPGFLPTIQVKNPMSGFMPTKYLTSSEIETDSGAYEEITLSLSNPDLELFLKHYEIIGKINWIDGFMFHASDMLFKEYVEYWYRVKETASIEKNEGMRTIAKLMLNSLYGKFGSRPEAGSKIPVLDPTGKYVQYKTTEKQPVELKYLPVAIFTTAWARYDIITLGQKFIDRLLYIDTDSLHLVGKQIPESIDVHPTRLGAWKDEYTFSRARYLNAKRYIEDTEKGLIIKCAGMPNNVHSMVTWENFFVGSEFEGKLRHKTVEGGVILTPTPYKIKPS